jgi:hypothetical protein
LFSKGGVESAALFADLDQIFRINKNNSTTFASTTTGNPANLKMTITPSTGLFTGTFTLKDTVSSKVISRPITYQGIFLSHRNKGYGYFLLPEINATAIFGGRALVN